MLRWCVFLLEPWPRGLQEPQNRSQIDSLTSLEAKFQKTCDLFKTHSSCSATQWFSIFQNVPFRGLEASKIFKKLISVCMSLWRPQNFRKYLPKSSTGSLPGGPGGCPKSIKSKSGTSRASPNLSRIPWRSSPDRFLQICLPIYWFSGFCSVWEHLY